MYYAHSAPDPVWGTNTEYIPIFVDELSRKRQLCGLGLLASRKSHPALLQENAALRISWISAS